MKKLKKLIYKIIKKNKFGCVCLFKVLLFYRKLRYLKYKYKFNVDNGIILFDASEGFNNEIKEIYEKMLYDYKYNGFQFVVALKEPKKEKKLIKDKSTVIIKRKSKSFLKYSSKAKYWFKNSRIDLHITPKKEQVVVLAKLPKNIKNDTRLKKTKLRIRNKYIKKYIDFKLYEIDFKISKNEIVQCKNNFYKKYNIDSNKKIIQYKIYFKEYNEYFFEDYFGKDILNKLYKMCRDDYYILINTNFDVSTVLTKKYKNFFIDVSNEEEVLVNKFTNLLITNKIKFINNSCLNKKQKLLFSNYVKLYSKCLKKKINLYVKPNFINIENFLEKNKKIILKEKKDYIIKNNLKIEKICENIILSKLNVHKTITSKLINEKLVPIKNKKIQLLGFFREYFFPLSNNFRMLKKYKNKYRGKRCFLIGNGPSLTFEDLDMLKDEITFGCNLIYKIYDKTEWRPTFHCLADGLYAKKVGSELVKEICSDVFTVDSVEKQLKKYSKKFKFISLKSISVSNNGKYKVVSPMRYHYPGGTVMSMMLCLAMYMGFDEIYLVGVDCTSSLSNNGHFIKGYMDSNIKRLDMKRIAKRLNKPVVTEEEVAKYYYDRVIQVYSDINEYAKKKKIKIYNSTRGGALEVYERKQIEVVLKEGVLKNENSSSCANKIE